MASLQDSVAVLNGVGPKMLEDLASVGIETILDLLTYFPFRFDDIKEREITEIFDGEKVVLKGLVVSDAVVNYYGPKKSRLAFRLMQDGVVINVTFFNQPYLAQKIILGENLAVFGKWDAKKRALTGMKIFGQAVTADFQPVYHVVKSLSQARLIKIIHQAFADYSSYITETLPADLIKKYQLLDRATALYAMHFPKDATQGHESRRRVVFEEFFYFQLKMLSLKQKEQQKNVGSTLHFDNQKLKQFIETLPFELTTAQKKVTNEICRDLLQPIHMQRLLQGDVGSGKTIVALLAMYAAITAGAQTALMVPTEILAQQHFETFQKLLKETPIKVGLLTSSTKTAEKREILAQLANGEMNLVIGTHALIQETVQFKNLGFVVTDEQHRFGVNQRKTLREKGHFPEVLFMTATPIPRTLAITAFGEMDVSIIDELPKGRQKILTKWVRPPQFDQVMEFMAPKIKAGDQAYLVSPLIGESETLDLENAQALFVETQANFPDLKVGLLHGQMTSAEKNEIMGQFKENNIQILVTTTVVEVGVDVPNATFMIIMDADRFGLSQLHQLRGRVGRGSKASLCVLVADPKGENGKERMKIMTETTDGFVLAQKDLEMRGPGEFFGQKQSGLPQFQVGDLARDEDILQLAQQEAKQLLANERSAEILQRPPFKEALAQQVFSSYFD
ncbi:ATP-dependent DNA helicase RecG [Enterococcus timonensis]|uniref:ATP-dependent DNA helicase RecG n=1 Tax=Enterococcus timonensis TaxID=1852364 RepID=UPI0008D9EA1E|nr:ATP-dependent DNA helicase RecG [Enterococcus timonensis]